MKKEAISGFAKYRPLIVISVLILLMCIAFLFANGSFDADTLMRNFMGLFFVIFSMFKLINIEGFQKGFSMYDILAKKYKAYGYIYPFIELALGLAYLSNTQPIMINLITFIVMTISSIGVIKSIKSGLNFKCACLGTILNVPLSTVSIIENVGMCLMSTYMLLKEFI